MTLTRTDFIFSDQRSHRVSGHLIFWITWLLFFTLIYGIRPNGLKNGMEFSYIQSYTLSFLEALIYLPTHILFSYLIIYLLIPQYLYLSESGFRLSPVRANYLNKGRSPLISALHRRPFPPTCPIARGDAHSLNRKHPFRALALRERVLSENHFHLGILKNKYWQLLVGFAVVILLVQSLAHYLTEQLIVHLRHSLGQPAPISNFYYGILAGLRGGLTVGGFAASIKIMKHWYLKLRDNQLLIQKNLENELQMLKSQVHPHFLFNTLNNLYALTLRNSSQSPEVVLKLSELLSYMLYDCIAPKVLLEKEIALLKNYVALESIRYEDRLDISLNIAGEVNGKLVAPLLLLPFLENAFKHGTSEQLDQAWISLDLSVKNNVLKFKLINSKNPDPILLAKPEGIGLQNVRKRLELIYPQQHELIIFHEEETFVVILTLQLETSDQKVSTLVQQQTANTNPQHNPTHHL